MATADVTVMGAGVFGLSIAYCCARRGALVRVIDPYGVAAGASGGIVGALAPHVPEQWNAKKQFQLDSLLMAEGFWRGVQDTGGVDPGYARNGRLQPLADAAAVALARTRVAGAAAHWQGQAAWEVVRAGGNWGPVSASGWLVRDSLSARIHPRRATQALAAAVVALGGEVVTDGATEGRVVWATGWQGLGEVGGGGVKGQAALLRFAAQDQCQIFAEGVHMVPHGDGTVAVGSTSERVWDTPGTDAQLDDLIDRAVAAMPVLRGAAVVERWAGVRPRSTSRAPLLGAHPARAGQFIANGGFKIGFGMAPKVGVVTADLLLDGIDAIPDGFR